jgi:quinol monooxygenase YgiN
MLANYYKVSVPEKFINKVILQMIKVQNHFMKNVDGCIKYQCSQDLEDKTIMYLLVIWEDKEIYEGNLDSEYQKKEIFDKFIEYNAAIIAAEQFTVSNHSIVV